MHLKYQISGFLFIYIDSKHDYSCNWGFEVPIKYFLIVEILLCETSFVEGSFRNSFYLHLHIYNFHRRKRLLIGCLRALF